MPDANEQHGERQGANDPAGSGPAPDETQEGAQPGDDQMGAGDGEQPEELEEPLEPYQIILQGFWTVFQTLSAAYGAPSSEIQTLVRKHLKGEARSVHYNLEIAILNEYRNLHIRNLKEPPNTDDHSAYLSCVKDVSWSYPAKGNLMTARQYYPDLKASKDPEAIEAGNTVLWDKGMIGIPQESSKAGPIKCRYVIYVLRSVKGQIIDARDRTTDETGTSGYTILSARLPPGRLRRVVPLFSKAGMCRGR